MATVHTVIVIKHEDIDTIAEVISKLDDSGAEGAVNKLVAHLAGTAGGVSSAEVEVTIRDTDPAVATSGAGSVQRTHDLK